MHPYRILGTETHVHVDMYVPKFVYSVCPWQNLQKMYMYAICCVCSHSHVCLSPHMCTYYYYYYYYTLTLTVSGAHHSVALRHFLLSSHSEDCSRVLHQWRTITGSRYITHTCNIIHTTSFHVSC